MRLGPEGLEAWLGAMRIKMTPVREGLLGASGSPFEEPEVLTNSKGWT